MSLYVGLRRDSVPLLRLPNNPPALDLHPSIHPSPRKIPPKFLQTTLFGRSNQPNSRKPFPQPPITVMLFFSTMSPSSQPTTTPNHRSIFGSQKLHQLTSKILQKLKLSTKTTQKNDDDTSDLEAEPEMKAARFVTFIRPTAAPQIIDLKALKRKSLPQLTPIHVYRSNVSRSKAELVSPNLLRHQRSLRAECSSSMERGAPLLLGDAEQVPVLGLTSRRSAAAAATFDDIADYDGYELLDEQGVDVDWSLLDLPEPVLRRLANESCHSLI